MPTLEAKIESHTKKIDALEAELTAEGKDIEKARERQRKKSRQYHELMDEREKMLKVARMSDDELSALSQVMQMKDIKSEENIPVVGDSNG
jgi:chromosome segregation ATPase